ncbi:putative ubiquitin modification-dependent histone binding [Lyophyllum shimeji]|uniref:Ubiquitin modification-dependent histone binding n=1 Tax=Lyophyllum shimeji TaxID=47721 RepID=A0A9P3PG66_LYOSH|nr:putative ubiquitin modification-dependent histone binding [Lyophyllum shimeji]
MMNTVDGSSDLESESQATQLLQSILDPNGHTWETSYIRGSHPSDGPNMTKDSNAECSPSRSSGSLPNYHFHGLAQTQTQVAEDEVEISEGSQKENINTRKVAGGEEREVAMQTPSAAQCDPSSGLPLSSLTKPKAAGVKAVSFQSRTKAGVSQTVHSPSRRNPTRSTTYPAAGAAFTKPVASPVSSQDSFGVLDEDPEQQFLATSKHFNVPLSELPRVVLPSANSSASAGRSPKPMRPFDPRNRLQRSPSPPQGTVLVEPTPSASGDSQSQPSQPYLDSQVELPSRQPDDMEIDMPVDDAGDISRYSTDDCPSDAPSSSYYTHLENRDEDNPPPALQATQPSTQVEEDNGMDEQPVRPFDAPVGTSNNHGGTAQSTVTTNSRNLLSMVDPRKRYRYQQYESRPTGLPQVQHELPAASGAGNSAVAHLEETQPSFEPETTMPPRGRFPPRANPPPSPPSLQQGGGLTPVIAMEETLPSFEEEMPRPAQRRFPPRPAPAAPPHRQAGDNDQMDIVPDSEPLRVEAASESGDNSSRSPGKSPIRPSSDRREVSMAVEEVGNKASAADVASALFPAGEEADEEEEEDVPLAAVICIQGQRSGATAWQGKGKAPVDGPQPGKTSSARQRKQSAPAGSKKQNMNALAPALAEPELTSNARTTRTTASLPAKKPSGAGRSWQTGEIPSSVPEQDLEKGTASKRLRADTTASNKGKGKALSEQTRAKPRRNATVPNGRSRRRATTDDESPLSASDDELLMRAADDEDDGTEPADEEYMDPDFAGPSSRKRKRSAGPPKTTKANSKASKKPAKVPSTTPSTRQTKRLRSAASAVRSGDWEPTRVFALWKQDGHFYPGTVHSHLEGARYTVHFDDLTEGVVAVDQMRLLDLRVGDDVILPKLTRGVKVVDVSKLESDDLVSVRLDSGVTEVSLQAIKIASKTISYAWKNRTISADSLVTTVKPERGKPSPTPSRLSLVSGPSTRGPRSNIFEKTALVVTISSNGNWEKEKESVMSAVKNNGGCVINDWSDVIRMEGKHSQGNQRWVICRSDAQWTGKDDIERVFLLADDSSLKPKFLIALALGIPCLSVSWLHDSVALGEEKDWQAYMLPQGYSEALGARASQQVDVDWGNSVHQLNDIMDNRVPCKIFDGKSILCVGPEMVPSPKGRKLTGAEEKTQEAHNAVTRIILAMGADRVEAVSDVRYASASLSSFDFVIIKEANQYGSHLEDGRTVHWPWVKDCLIASRLLPIPEWVLQQSESQDA